MNWYQIIQLVLAVLRILDMLPKEKKSAAEKEAFEAVAKIITETSTA